MRSPKLPGPQRHTPAQTRADPGAWPPPSVLRRLSARPSSIPGSLAALRPDYPPRYPGAAPTAGGQSRKAGAAAPSGRGERGLGAPIGRCRLFVPPTGCRTSCPPSLRRCRVAKVPVGLVGSYALLPPLYIPYGAGLRLVALPPQPLSGTPLPKGGRAGVKRDLPPPVAAAPRTQASAPSRPSVSPSVQPTLWPWSQQWGLCCHIPWAGILALPITSCPILGESLSCAEPQFLLLLHGDDNSPHGMVCSWG